MLTLDGRTEIRIPSGIAQANGSALPTAASMFAAADAEITTYG